MKDIDAKIRAALQNEDRELFDQYAGQLSSSEQVVQTFKGRSKMLNVADWIFMLVFSCLAIYCGFRFFETDVISERFTWAVGLMATMIIVMMMFLILHIPLSIITIAIMERISIMLTHFRIDSIMFVP